MKFGIFYEHQLPRPWGPTSEHTLIQNSLAQIELADRLGYDYAWEVEHHFLEEYSHSSAPEVFLAAASQRTKRIRLGHGIIQLTTNHPARVAERSQHARSRLERPRGVGPGRRLERDRAAPLRPALPRQARRLGRRREGRAPDVHSRRLGVSRQVLRLPAAQRGAEAAAEAAPAAVGRVLAARHDRDGGPARHGRAGLPVRLGRSGARLGARVLQRVREAPRAALRLPDQPADRDRVRLHVRARRTRRRIAEAEGWTFFQFALGFYNSHGPVVPGQRESVGRVPDVARDTRGPEGAARRRRSSARPRRLRARLRKFERVATSTR